MSGKTVVAISSLTMRGAVGLRAVQFALERRGHTVWPVPTVTMPWHPGLGASTRHVPPPFPTQLAELARHAGEVDAVLTGYFAEASQVHAAAAFIDAVRAAGAALIAVDPVTGDERGRYVPDAVAEAIRDALLPRADIATPNVNELADLGGAGAIVEVARRLGPSRVVVTSTLVADDRIAATLVEPDGTVTAEHRAVRPAPRGTGDLFAAVLLAALIEGASEAEALHQAAAATLGVVEASGPDALAIGRGQDAIADPPLRSVAIELAGERYAGRQQRVVGLDGCAGAWAAVTINADGPPEPMAELLPSAAAALARGHVVAVDMPIGLPDIIEGPGRATEQAVRPLLGARQSSVFSVPSRSAVYAASYGEACRAGLASSTPPRKVSRQAYNLFAQIRELDGLLSPRNQHRVFETHAELAFWRLNGDEPMRTPKRIKGVPAAQGLGERIALLVRHGMPRPLFERDRPAGMPLVDLVDASALALIARRCAHGTAEPFPDPPAVDGRGLRIAIWA